MYLPLCRTNNPEVSIGGYFIISQMLSYTRGLVSLDLAANSLTAAEARVLCLGMRSNRSVQELSLKENTIGSEGATNFAEMLKINSTLMLLDLRTNNIRGNGICVLADSMSENGSLTQLDGGDLVVSCVLSPHKPQSVPASPYNPLPQRRFTVDVKNFGPASSSLACTGF